MDIARFEAFARDPNRTIAELTTMKKNALAKGRNDLARIVDDVLRERNPTKGKKSGGKTPTTAVFRESTQQFDPTAVFRNDWLDRALF